MTTAIIRKYLADLPNMVLMILIFNIVIFKGVQTQ